MRKSLITVFTLDELEPKAREAAIEAHRDVNILGDWWEYLNEDFTTRLSDVGLAGSTFYWQLDGQGRGIWCDDLAIQDVSLLLQTVGVEPDEENTEEDVISLYLRGERYKVNRFRVALDSDHIAGSIENALNAVLAKLMGQFLDELEAEYEHLTSDEMVAETLLANDYEFVALGDTWPSRWESVEEPQ